MEPPSIEAATSILRGLRPRYERHHGITISEAALLAAAALSSRYISGRHLPDKAIDCLDEAAAQVGQLLWTVLCCAAPLMGGAVLGALSGAAGASDGAFF